MRISRDQGLPAIIGGLIAFLPLLGIVWVGVKPAISTALADDIKTTVKNEVAPIRGGFDVLLTQQILQTQKEIALMERKGVVNLTPEETTRLVELRAQLEAQQRALAQLRQ